VSQRDVLDVDEDLVLALLAPDLVPGVPRIGEDGADRALRPRGVVAWGCGPGRSSKEALIAVGEHTRAAILLGQWADLATRLDRVSARAAAARCRALLLAATGDHAAAIDAVDAALAEYDRVDLPFDRARTLLVAGRLHRRTKHKRAARDTLTAARDVFAELGARQFLAQTDHDLARIGLRTTLAPAGVDGLTATEHRVVELAADGRTTKEIAGQLFLSTKTVEANLTRIYRKLRLRSRADLANWRRDQHR
jgi:DNA-binding CsgD family transcriptional regulator